MFVRLPGIPDGYKRIECQKCKCIFDFKKEETTPIPSTGERYGNMYTSRVVCPCCGAPNVLRD